MNGPEYFLLNSWKIVWLQSPVGGGRVHGCPITAIRLGEVIEKLFNVSWCFHRRLKRPSYFALTYSINIKVDDQNLTWYWNTVGWCWDLLEPDKNIFIDNIAYLLVHVTVCSGPCSLSVSLSVNYNFNGFDGDEQEGNQKGYIGSNPFNFFVKLRHLA